MDALESLIIFLRTLKGLFPIESALTLGVIFFALSCFARRAIVDLPPASENTRSRRTTLTRFGIWAPLAILLVTFGANWITITTPVTEVHWTSGSITRPLPLAATAVAIAILGVALAREPRPASAERTITPHRRWWTNLPTIPALLAGIVAGILGSIALWQALAGRVPPADANRYGIGSLNEEAPTYQEMQGGLGYFDGAGWPNHGTTLLALALILVAAGMVLGRDANRAVMRSTPPSQTHAERRSTARLIALVSLGGLLLTAGVVLAHVGFTGSIVVSAVGMSSPHEAGDTFFAGSDFRAIAEPMHLGGYLVQGLGAALLLRIIVDTIRVRREAGARFKPTAQDPETTLAKTEASA